uniref:Uncharacterized protein n=1 Tax=Quercus lobata TaxID=97700 RepID=A0A7N2MFN6_QUELO
MKIASNIPALLLCLIILLILFIFFSLSLSASKQHNPFLSTYEFIFLKKSSRGAVFFVFNVIVITICRGSFKPSDGDFDYFLSFPLTVYEFDDDTKDEDYDDSDEYHGDDGEGSDDDVDSNDEQAEDLETRIEDFIAKGHRQWREELIYERFLCIAATEFQ